MRTSTTLALLVLIGAGCRSGRRNKERQKEVAPPKAESIEDAEMRMMRVGGDSHVTYWTWLKSGDKRWEQVFRDSQRELLPLAERVLSEKPEHAYASLFRARCTWERVKTGNPVRVDRQLGRRVVADFTRAFAADKGREEDAIWCGLVQEAIGEQAGARASFERALQLHRKRDKQDPKKIKWLQNLIKQMGEAG